MKKYYFAIALGAMLLAGCSNKELAPRQLETTWETEAVEKAVEQETGVDNQEKKKTETLIPMRYEMHEDGQSHFVLYHADEDKTLFADFTNVSYPELGVQSVSFLSHLIDPDDEEIYTYNNEDIVIDTKEKAWRVYDLTSLEQLPDNEMHRECYAVGRCGVFNLPNTFQGLAPTEEEAKEIFWQQYGIATTGEIEMIKSQDGGNLFIAKGGASGDADNNKVFYGFMIFRLKRDVVQGIYALFDAEWNEAMEFLEYTKQSLKFAS